MKAEPLRNSPFLRVAPPLALMLVLLVIVENTHWDEWCMSLVYDSVSQSFPMKRNFFFDTVLHDWARNIPIGLAIATLFVLALHPEPQIKKAAVFIFISMLISTALVASIKATSLIHCPYYLAKYGGDFQEVGLLDFVVPNQEPGKCWPSGHASGGFALLALYFAAKIYNPSYQTRALVFALMIGLIFTLSQTIRGAHFPSHGLWSLLIAWLVNELLYLVWTRGETNTGHITVSAT